MQIAKVAALMTGMTVLLVAAGAYVGGQGGAVVMLGIAALMNFGSYWFSDRMVLRMYKAQVVGPEQAPELYGMVERLAQKAGLPTPTVAISPQPQPNAFATGRNPEHGVVCFTQGILQALSQEELEGVTAHELAHIQHRHMLVSAIAATMAGAITMLLRFSVFFGGRDRNQNIFAMLALLIIAPIAAMIVRMAISRQNEFQADATAARIAGTHRGLTSALRRLDGAARKIPMDVNPAAAQLAIVNPFSGRRMGLQGLISTHPPMEDRIARLEALG